jgi:hypothetical protein
VWIPTVSDQEDLGVAACSDCSRNYDVRAKLRDLDLYAFQRDAHDFARNAGIDLPAAYSILLGITTLEAVQYTVGQKETEQQRSFDPSFADAVAAGLLTPQQAAMRGTRRVFARRLVERHGITLPQALDVADNRIPLREALQQARPQEVPQVEPPPRRFPWGRVVLVAGALVVGIAVATAVVITRHPEVSADPIEVQQEPSQSSLLIESLKQVETQIVFDDGGLATEITGGNPEAVLNAYCRSIKGFKAEPITLQADGQDWNGLYRTRGTLYSIPIRWDPARGLWVLGNGVDRIRGETVPETTQAQSSTP